INYPLEDGATALRFDPTAFAAFELYILQLPEAKARYSDPQQQQAKAYYDSLSKDNIDELTHTILLGLPGDEEMNLETFRLLLEGYENIDDRALRTNLYSFLEEVKIG